MLFGFPMYVIVEPCVEKDMTHNVELLATLLRGPIAKFGRSNDFVLVIDDHNRKIPFDKSAAATMFL